MKKSLFLYLFIIAILLNVFTYMYYSKALDFETNHNGSRLVRYKDSLTNMASRLQEAEYFALETNQNAQEYFENKEEGTFLAPEKLIPFLKERLAEENDNPAGNRFVGFEKMNDQKFIINKVKVLNHRWIIADFSNGSIWGEVLIKYFINEDGTASFQTIESLIYPKIN
jgi:hypothetical protein